MEDVEDAESGQKQNAKRCAGVLGEESTGAHLGSYRCKCFVYTEAEVR